MLYKKLFRDMKNNLSQFITIFLMIFLGIFVFAGIHSYMDGMKVNGDKYYKDYNLPDLWLAGENFTDDDLTNIKKIDNVNDAERVLTITTNLEKYKGVTVETNFIETNNISKMKVIEGEKYSNKPGVWLDSYLAKNLDLKVGDIITLSYENYKITETIQGLVNTPDHIYQVKDETELYPDHTKYGYAYLSINEFPEGYVYQSIEKNTGMTKNQIRQIPNFNIKDYYVFNHVLVDTSNNSEEVKEEIEDNIRNAISVTTRSDNSSYQIYKSEIEDGDTYAGIFTFLFLFIALLSVVTTMNRFIKKERVQIGLLKALGFNDKRITRHYISYGFYISLMAAITGLIVGPLVLGNFFLNMLKKYYEMPEVGIYITKQNFILAIIVIGLVTLVTYLSCKKILKEPASNALRNQDPNIKNKKFNLTTKRIFKKTSISTKWNIRDIARNKGRALMAIVGIAGATMLLVCAFGMLDSMNSYLDWEFNKLSNYDYKLVLKSDYSNEDLKNIENKYGKETSRTNVVEINTGNETKITSLTINDTKESLRYTDHNKNYMKLKSDGIYITEKLAETLSLKKGDDITIKMYENQKKYKVKIIGLTRDPQNQQLNANKEFYESLDLTYRPDTVYTNKDLKNVKTIKGVEKIQSINTIRDGMNSLLETTKTMISLLIVVSAGLTIVIIYNLGVLSFTEQEYQFATLRVLGFKNEQIKRIFEKQNIWLTLVAILIGMPLGYVLTDSIFTFSLGENSDFNADIRLISYLLAFIGILLVSIIVNKLISKKINKIDMVSSLKSNE